MNKVLDTTAYVVPDVFSRVAIRPVGMEVYRLMTGSRYRDLPQTSKYELRATYHWVERWTEAGVLDRIRHVLLSFSESDGELGFGKGPP